MQPQTETNLKINEKKNTHFLNEVKHAEQDEQRASSREWQRTPM